MIGQGVVGCRVDKNIHDTTINKLHAGFCLLRSCLDGDQFAEGSSGMYLTPEGC